MSRVLLYIPPHRMTDQTLWQEIRDWQKTAAISWDKIRCTPASIGDDGVAREEMKSALNLIRQGSFERVVYADLPKDHHSNLEWLLFALSCQAQNVRVENLQGLVELPEGAHQLAAAYSQLAKPASAAPMKKSRPLEASK